MLEQEEDSQQSQESNGVELDCDALAATVGTRQGAYRETTRKQRDGSGQYKEGYYTPEKEPNEDMEDMVAKLVKEKEEEEEFSVSEPESEPHSVSEPETEEEGASQDSKAAAEPEPKVREDMDAFKELEESSV